MSCCLFFFFSSRRRHTRFSRDWSSDVCSSDLPQVLAEVAAGVRRANQDLARAEQVRRFTLLPAEWTAETGELTPTLKRRRRVIARASRRRNRTALRAARPGRDRRDPGTRLASRRQASPGAARSLLVRRQARQRSQRLRWRTPARPDPPRTATCNRRLHVSI